MRGCFNFGLCNAPATFERLMDRVLCDMRWSRCLFGRCDLIRRDYCGGPRATGGCVESPQQFWATVEGEEMYIYADGRGVPGSHRWPYWIGL